MTAPLWIDAIGNLGAPIAFAALLIWHIVHSHRALTAQTNKQLSQIGQLLAEIGQLRAEITQLNQNNREAERQFELSDKLRGIIESRDREMLLLVRTMVEAQINHNGPISAGIPPQPARLQADLIAVSPDRSRALAASAQGGTP